jgi:CRP-like cAMP-binding protein
VLLLEPIPFEDKLRAVAEFAGVPSEPEVARQRARGMAEIWLGPPGPHESDAPAAQVARETQMERLLSLRQVSLFSRLSLERLQAIARIMREAEYVRGEVICRQGTPGEELYLMIEGEVGIYRDLGTAGEELLNTVAAGGYFGEIAVLDRSDRSASVVAGTDVRVLVLEGARLRELVLEMPEIAFEIFHELIARIRVAEGRLEGSRSERRLE